MGVAGGWAWYLERQQRRVEEDGRGRVVRRAQRQRQVRARRRHGAVLSFFNLFSFFFCFRSWLLTLTPWPRPSIDGFSVFHRRLGVDHPTPDDGIKKEHDDIERRRFTEFYRVLPSETTSLPSLFFVFAEFGWRRFGTNRIWWDPASSNKYRASKRDLLSFARFYRVFQRLSMVKFFKKFSFFLNQ